MICNSGTARAKSNQTSRKNSSDDNTYIKRVSFLWRIAKYKIHEVLRNELLRKGKGFVILMNVTPSKSAYTIILLWKFQALSTQMWNLVVFTEKNDLRSIFSSFLQGLSYGTNGPRESEYGSLERTFKVLSTFLISKEIVKQRSKPFCGVGCSGNFKMANSFKTMEKLHTEFCLFVGISAKQRYIRKQRCT